MRWDNLTSAPPGPEVPGAGGEAGPCDRGLRSAPPTGDPAGAAPAELPLALPGAVVRTFDTPDFADMTLYEVRAKSIINRVPGTSRVPFTFTVNPYRGCGHACTYCLAGDTPILLASGFTAPLAELRPGDRIIGTVEGDNHRRLVPTDLLDHWSTVKPAYRVVLDDGTELVASGDHRFLTERGWKHVTAAANGEPPRPYLTPGERLMSLGEHPGPGGPAPVGPAEPALTGTVLERRAARRICAVEVVGQRMTLYDITTGTGDFIADGVVSHNCFARHTHTYLDLDPGLDFDRRVVVKVNAGELIRRELAAPKWRGAHIAMGTNVDCYQRAEGRYRLMPEIIAALTDFANPFSILTKGTLVLRDLALLRRAADVAPVGVSFSVGFVDETLWRSVEPGTPHPRRRLDAVRTLADAGFPVGVLMAPILPGLTDTDCSIEETVAAIATAGAASVTPLPLHLRPGARQWYAAWLAREHPRLVPRYRELYGRGSYLPKEYQHEVVARVRAAAERYGLRRAGSAEARRADRAGEAAADAGDPTADRPANPAAEQLTLL